MIRSKLTSILTLFSLFTIFVACNFGSVPNADQQLSAHTQVVQSNVVSSISTDNIVGNIRFFLTDAPLDDVAQVNITVTELRVKKHIDDTATDAQESGEATDSSSTGDSATNTDSNSGTADADANHDEGDDSEWETITFDPARVIDLKKLADGLTDVLGDLNLPTGVYKEIRLHVTQSEVVLNDGTKETLKIPSGDSSGLKIKFKGDGVTIEEGKKYALVLDFDLAKSLTRKSDHSHGTGSSDSHDANESESGAEDSTDGSTGEETTSTGDSTDSTSSTGDSNHESTSTDTTSSTGDSQDATTDDASENDSVEGSTWILKPVIRVSYVAEVDESTGTATVIVTDE